MQTRIRVVHGVGMGVDAERREVFVLPAELVHISAHDEGINSHERNPLLHFVIGIVIPMISVS